MNKPVYLGLPILEIRKTLMYEFWYDYIKRKCGKKQNHVIWMHKALLFILKLKIFIKILLMMLKNGLIHQIMSAIGHCLKENTRKKSEK